MIDEYCDNCGRDGCEGECHTDDEFCPECGLYAFDCECFPDTIEEDEFYESDFLEEEFGDPNPDQETDIFDDLQGISFLDFDEYE
jgi:hypothetical protein